MGWMALLPLAISAYQAIQGGINKDKAQKERLRLANSRPEFESSEYLDNVQDLAESELSRGNNTPARIAMQRALDGNFSSGIQAILQTGGSPGNVADLYGQAQTGQMRMAMDGDQLRQRQIANLMAASQASEGNRQQQFQFNQAMPFFDNAQAAAAQYQAANNQMWNGISSAGASLANWGSGMENANAYNSYFNSGVNNTNLPSQGAWSNGINNPDFSRYTKNYRW